MMTRDERVFLGAEMSAIDYLARKFYAAKYKLDAGASRSTWENEIWKLEELCRQFLDRRRPGA
jgi:hypothetical protein